MFAILEFKYGHKKSLMYFDNDETAQKFADKMIEKLGAEDIEKDDYGNYDFILNNKNSSLKIYYEEGWATVDENAMNEFIKEVVGS